MKQDKFGKATNVWFPFVAERSMAWSSKPFVKTANAILKRIPSKHNLLSLIELLDTKAVHSFEVHGQEHLAILNIVKQANAIIAGEFNEFRFRYSKMVRLKGQCSATSEFFSMLTQALNYNSLACAEEDRVLASM